ncbi:MAG TPA: hypothetical protein VEC15_11405 [Actinomycetota bacterium]|jgi:hypothetical protein|nr:hypothetical protein [Actinomycetota bacterium]
MQTRNCDQEHARASKAIVRVMIKSTHANRPGRPMIRERYLCRAHATELRALGFELVGL